MGTTDEDEHLSQFGYTQKLNRSVGKLSSFLLGFAVISATTAVFSGFGYGIATAGPAFVWTFPLAVAIFFVWALIAGDLVAKLPLSGYAYQWTTRLVSPHMGWFTGFAGAVGFISGFTGVAYVMAGYLGNLFGLQVTASMQIWLSIAIVLVCVVINVYGVRLATVLNNIGVALEFVVTIGSTAVIAIVAFSSGTAQSIDFLFQASPVAGAPYILIWLTSSLACIFGLLGVEAAADIAEETKDARRVIPRTMFYALGTAAVIEFAMYIIYLLAVNDSETLAESASPVADIFSQQVSPLFAKLVVLFALTNILVCVLANMLVATRVVYSMARDNMLPGSTYLRRVSAKYRVPTNAVWATGLISTLLLLSAFANEVAFAYITGMSALGYFTVYILTTSGLLNAHMKGRIPKSEPGYFDLGRARVPLYLFGIAVFGIVLAALMLLPDFRANGVVFLITMASASLYWLLILRKRIAKGAAGPEFAFALRDSESTAPTHQSHDQLAAIVVQDQKEESE
ncbi:APC family permease [Brevibacterium aurantiacum]|uniref:Amino acid permease n=1 Tax=Brevibacterium aurantiacum TaxID=273384 RepID=A0A556CCE2_BREAU|nr:amino acid permease [Brevibacterium aurantiacum]TSI15101.1 amino acid permease [Brevibacterium aurantiacum]